MNVTKTDGSVVRTEFENNEKLQAALKLAIEKNDWVKIEVQRKRRTRSEQRAYSRGEET